MHVVIVTQYYPPEVGAPQARLSHLARSLVAAGETVTVVTAMPNYPSGRIHETWRGKGIGSEEIDGVRVLRTWMYSSPARTTRRLLISYGSFVASSAVTSPFRLRRADVVLWESPPLFLAPVARLLAARLRARLVMNVSDLWPASAVALNVVSPGRVLAAAERLERWAYDSADLVTCQTSAIRREVSGRSTTATALFPNGVDLNFFRVDSAGERLGVRSSLDVSPEDFLVGYLGNFGRAQALGQVIDAARLVRDPTVRFIMVGDGPCRAEVEEGAAGIGRRLTVLPSVPKERMPSLLSALDLAIVPLAAADVFAGARPSKMFELMAMGVPFVYCGRGEGAEVADGSGAARIVAPEEPAELADAIKWWRGLPITERRAAGERGRTFVEERFDRSRIALDMIELLREIACRS